MKKSKLIKKAGVFIGVLAAVPVSIAYKDYTSVMAQDINVYNQAEDIIEERYQGNNLMYTYYGFANMDGVWYNFIEGSVNDEYTGMGPVETGWSYFINGVQSFTYTGPANNQYGWWYYFNGNIDFTFDGQITTGGYRYDIVNGQIVNTTECRTISCWGDSMTEGVGATAGTIKTDNGYVDLDEANYPNDLAALTGYNVNNFGIAGAESDAITGGAYQYYTDYENTNDILILEMGSNGGWDNDYDKLINQYTSIVEMAGTDQYIIVGDTDDPVLLIDDNQSAYVDDDSEEYVGHNQTKWESALSEAFGVHFFNTRLYLLDNGLSDSELTPTQQDMDMIAKGNIPSELRSDLTHFNNYGYYSKALGIYKKGKELGYW